MWSTPVFNFGKLATMYQFQVVALGLQGGEEFEGARSVLDCNSMATTECNCSPTDKTGGWT